MAAITLGEAVFFSCLGVWLVGLWPLGKLHERINPDDEDSGWRFWTAWLLGAYHTGFWWLLALYLPSLL